MSRLRKSPRPEAEAERLREVFAEAAYDVIPSAVPLAAVERAGRRRRRRRAGSVVGAACAVLLVSLGAVVLRESASTGPGDRAAFPGVSADGSPSSSATGSTVRVVTPGERVQVAPGTRIWLTEDGKHWISPGSPQPRFRGIADENAGLSTPGVSLQEESDGHSTLLSGIYHGKGDAARVEIETAAGDVVGGTALTLAGSPHWGVWYAMVKKAKTPRATTRPERYRSEAPESVAAPAVTKRVTVYDSAGKVIATMDFAS